MKVTCSFRKWETTYPVMQHHITEDKTPQLQIADLSLEIKNSTVKTVLNRYWPRVLRAFPKMYKLYYDK
jgi:hypothetical protein